MGPSQDNPATVLKAQLRKDVDLAYCCHAQHSACISKVSWVDRHASNCVVFTCGSALTLNPQNRPEGLRKGVFPAAACCSGHRSTSDLASSTKAPTIVTLRPSGTIKCSDCTICAWLQVACSCASLDQRETPAAGSLAVRRLLLS